MATQLWWSRLEGAWQTRSALRFHLRALGRPDFDVNVGDLKPNWLVGVAAVAMLALRQPLTGVKTFGDTSFTDPFNGVAKVVMRATHAPVNQSSAVHGFRV